MQTTPRSRRHTRHRRRPSPRVLGPDDTIPVPDPPSPPSGQGTPPADPPPDDEGDDDRNFAKALGGCLVLMLGLVLALVVLFWLVFLPGAAVWSLWYA